MLIEHLKISTAVSFRSIRTNVSSKELYFLKCSLLVIYHEYCGSSTNNSADRLLLKLAPETCWTETCCIRANSSHCTVSEYNTVLVTYAKSLTYCTYVSSLFTSNIVASCLFVCFQNPSQSRISGFFGGPHLITIDYGASLYRMLTQQISWLLKTLLL